MYLVNDIQQVLIIERNCNHQLYSFTDAVQKPRQKSHFLCERRVNNTKIEKKQARIDKTSHVI